MIRIVIADDQNIAREGIKILLQQAKYIDIVGIAEDRHNTGFHQLKLDKMKRKTKAIVTTQKSMPTLLSFALLFFALLFLLYYSI